MSDPSPRNGPRRRDLLGLNSRVARRLLLWAFAVGGIGTLAVSLGESFYAYRQRLEHIETQLRAVGEVALVHPGHRVERDRLPVA